MTTTRWGTGLRARLDLLLGTLRTRIELFALELHEAGLLLARLVFMTVLAALLLFFGLVLAVVWITVALWDEHRVLALGLGTLVFVGGGIAAATAAARALAATGRAFAATLAEFDRDRDALRGRRDA